MPERLLKRERVVNKSEDTWGSAGAGMLRRMVFLSRFLQHAQLNCEGIFAGAFTFLQGSGQTLDLEVYFV
jgi:hypothetical protein